MRIIIVKRIGRKQAHLLSFCCFFFFNGNKVSQILDINIRRHTNELSTDSSQEIKRKITHTHKHYRKCFSS